MGETKIEWADATWNPITGCSKISPGCQNCFAERMARRWAGRYGYPKDNPFSVTFHTDKLQEPLKWKKPKRVFVCSMGDLFYKDVKTFQLNSIFTIINASWLHDMGHQFLILTKRPSRMKKYIFEHRHFETAPCYYETSNVWLGVTAENQRCADLRIPILLQIPASVRFISVEPMLEPIHIKKQWFIEAHTMRRQIDLIILGCESGPNRRPCKIEWMIDLVEQCQAAGVSVFVKQININGRVSHDMEEWPVNLRVREFPK